MIQRHDTGKCSRYTKRNSSFGIQRTVGRKLSLGRLETDIGQHEHASRVGNIGHDEKGRWTNGGGAHGVYVGQVRGVVPDRLKSVTESCAIRLDDRGLTRA